MVMKPPTVGPSTGATTPGQVMVEIACIMRERSVLRTTIMRPTGTISAPPIPCSTRAAVKEARPVAEPHSTEATVKITMALANTLRDPRRSATQPLTGMNTASVSI